MNDNGWREREMKKYSGELLSSILIDQANCYVMNPFTDGDIEELLDEEDLPFVRYKLPPEEETPETLRTSEMLISTI